MAKWLCTCGNQMQSSGAIPNPQEWHVLSDAVLNDMPDQSTFEEVRRQSQYVYRCDHCDRLHVFWNGIGEWPPTIYAPEGN